MKHLASKGSEESKGFTKYKWRGKLQIQIEIKEKYLLRGKYTYKSGGRTKIRGEENTFFLFTVREAFLAKGPPTIRLPWYWSCKEGFPQLNYAIIDFRSCGISHSRFFWYMLSFRWTYFGMRSFWLIKAVKILPTDFLLEIFFGFSWSKSFGWSKW